MKEELMKQLIPLMEKAKDGLLGAADMLQEQAPILCEQILRWEFWLSFLSFVCWLFIAQVIGGFLFWACKLIHDSKDWYSFPGDPPPKGFVYLLLTVCYITIFAIVVNVNLTWLKIIIAPKLYLLGYISNLVK